MNKNNDKLNKLIDLQKEYCELKNELHDQNYLNNINVSYAEESNCFWKDSWKNKYIYYCDYTNFVVNDSN